MNWSFIIASLIGAIPPSIMAAISVLAILKARREARAAELAATKDRQELKKEVNGNLEKMVEMAHREGLVIGIQKGIQEEKGHSMDATRLLVEASPVGLLLAGPHERIKMVNKQIERMFGYLREELIGRNLEILIPHRYRPIHAGHMKDYMASPRARQMGGGLKLFGLHKEGHEIVVEISLSPVEMPDGLFVVASILEMKR